MDVCQRQTLRCFENTRDYVNVQAKDNLYGVNLKKFPSKCSCQRRNKSNYIYIYCRFELLLHMYCTVCTCTYSYMHALGISTTDVGSIHQKFFVNILSCWIRSHSFFLMLRFFRKYRFGFHNKSLLRTVYYCTVYARIHLLLKKEENCLSDFFLICSSFIQSYLVFQRHFNTQTLLQNIKARRKPFYSYCRYHPVWANWKISDLSFEGILLSTETLIFMTFDNDKFVPEWSDHFCLR